MRTVTRLALADARQAVSYLDAAQRVLGPYSGDHRGDVPMFGPASFLIAHAVELALNAFLRINGIKGGQSDHDLIGRLEAAKAAGLPYTSGLRSYVNFSNAPVKTGQFRYARDKPTAFVDPRQALSRVRPDVEAILTHVTAKAAEEQPDARAPVAHPVVSRG